MAKPTYHKLGLKPLINTNELEYNGQTITVKDYLPIEEKLNMIADILNDVKDENPFINVGKMNVYLYLHVLYNYTDLSFTEKQKEDPGKIYDSIMTTDFLVQVLKLIPKEELDFIKYLLDTQAEEIYKFNNSIAGIFKTISADYSNLDIEATDIQQKLKDPNNLTLLKGIMKELG